MASKTSPAVPSSRLPKGFEFTVNTKEAVDLATLSTHENVFLFVPNLIGAHGRTLYQSEGNYSLEQDMHE
jgi:hypothetical protein